MASIGHIEVEVRPTVTLESAVACVMMLNLFLAENEEYRLEAGDDGKWHLTDEPRPKIPTNIPIEDRRYPKPRYQREAELMNNAETYPFAGDLSAWPSPPNE